jgi:hypothetical protein
MHLISTSPEYPTSQPISPETPEQQTEKVVAASHLEVVKRLVYLEVAEGRTIPQILLTLIALGYRLLLSEYDPMRRGDGSIQCWNVDVTVKENTRGIQDASANIVTFQCAIDSREEYNEVRERFANLFSAVHSPRR